MKTTAGIILIFLSLVPSIVAANKVDCAFAIGGCFLKILQAPAVDFVARPNKVPPALCRRAAAIIEALTNLDGLVSNYLEPTDSFAQLAAETLQPSVNRENRIRRKLKDSIAKKRTEGLRALRRSIDWSMNNLVQFDRRPPASADETILEYVERVVASILKAKDSKDDADTIVAEFLNHLLDYESVTDAGLVNILIVEMWLEDEASVQTFARLFRNKLEEARRYQSLLGTYELTGAIKSNSHALDRAREVHEKSLRFWERSVKGTAVVGAVTGGALGLHYILKNILHLY